jgi:hypothetical protein
MYSPVTNFVTYLYLISWQFKIRNEIIGSMRSIVTFYNSPLLCYHNAESQKIMEPEVRKGGGGCKHRFLNNVTSDRRWTTDSNYTTITKPMEQRTESSSPGTVNPRCSSSSAVSSLETQHSTSLTRNTELTAVPMKTNCNSRHHVNRHFLMQLPFWINSRS